MFGIRDQMGWDKRSVLWDLKSKAMGSETEVFLRDQKWGKNCHPALKQCLNANPP